MPEAPIGRTEETETDDKEVKGRDGGIMKEWESEMKKRE